LKEVNRKYIALQSAIIKTGGVVCEQYPDVFFPEDVGALTDAAREMEEIAISLCKKCPVQKLCLDYAITAREPYGIWGGTKSSER
jgi:uncharacterized protein YciW